MKRNLSVLVCVFVLVLAACGSRTKDEGGTATTGLGGTTTAPQGTGQPEEGDKIGTLDNPCSSEAPTGGGSGSGAGAEAPGVTADSIKIGVISDKKNDITPVPTIGIEEAVKAFVDFCNESGGVSGRQLELKTYDSQIFKNDDVTKAACNDDLFALVGSGSVQDQQGITTREGCGLPEVGAYSATPERAQSKNFFQPVPGTLGKKFNIGPCKRIKDQFPDAVKTAAVIYTDVPASKSRGQAMKEACTKAGFTFVVEKGLAFGEKNFGPVVSEMKSKDVQYFTIISVVPDTSALLREMANQDYKPEVIDLGQQYYDPAMAAEPAADGAFVLTNTTPFAEADDTPALQVYETWLEKAGGKPSSLGVQAFSAGLLFAQAAASLGDDLTQEGLVEALKQIHEWDGGGLQMTADPGTNSHNDCFLYLQIKSGKFERSFPDEGFSCEPADVIELSKEYTTAG